jgi:hypothetical protein
MIALDDPRWTEFRSGYRVEYDARPLLARFSSGRDLDACWSDVWNELHHQGDVDTASYAVLPHLVEAARDQRRDWNLYAYAATLLLEAGQRANPSVPSFIEPGFVHAMRELFEMAVSDLRVGVGPLTLRSILWFLAAYGQANDLAKAIENIDQLEDFGLKVVEAERHGRN